MNLKVNRAKAVEIRKKRALRRSQAPAPALTAMPLGAAETAEHELFWVRLAELGKVCGIHSTFKYIGTDPMFS